MNKDPVQTLVLVINENDRQEFKRLDQYLDTQLPDFSRTYIKKLFQESRISLEGAQKIELKKMPPVDSKILINIPSQGPSELIPEDIPLEILFEDDHLVIINKPAGMVTHPAPGHDSGTLVHAILHHCPNLKGMHDEKRPGIVHRLDKGTSGVMVVAKSQKCHEKLVELFSTHSIERYYQAITLGPEVPSAGTIKTKLARHPQNRLKITSRIQQGKEAITYYKKIDSNKRLHHFELKLQTGRTHQIRVHLSEVLKHPILCDSLYANPKHQINTIPKNLENLRSLLQNYPHPLLHAKVLGFTHPMTQKELYFEKSPPKIFQQALEIIRAPQ